MFYSLYLFLYLFLFYSLYLFLYLYWLHLLVFAYQNKHLLRLLAFAYQNKHLLHLLGLGFHLPLLIPHLPPQRFQTFLLLALIF